MRKLALALAASACVAFAAPAMAAGSDLAGGVQVAHEDAQTTDFSAHRRWYRHRYRHHHHWRYHRHCWRTWHYGRRVIVCR